MAVAGLLIHFMKDMIRISIETKKRPTPIQYWMGNPYQSLISVLGCVVGFIYLQDTAQLSASTAFIVGYMSNSVADMIGKRGIK